MRHIWVWGPAAGAVLLTALSTGRAQEAKRPTLSGYWILEAAKGTTAPEGLALRVDQSAGALTVGARWKEPENGQYGLTLAGLLSPKLTFSLDGREDLNQSGPFVLRSKTAWSGNRLVTGWHTSEYLGMSFEGRWIHSLSADGQELILEIHGKSSQGRSADAVLRFRRFNI